MKTDVIPPAPSSLGLAAEECEQAARTRLQSYAQKLARIEAALSRMERGCYGFCLTCEGRIGLPRLEADPAEAMCETCDVNKGCVR
jgi:RNA polymerase-binding transcription factor DksA